MNDNSRQPMVREQGRRAGRSHADKVSADLDTIVRLGIDQSVAARLQGARRAALARLRGGFVPSGHWINWAPVGMALVVVLVTAWSLLLDNAHSLDADLLADALPFDAYLDADFESSVGGDAVQLLEN